MEDGLEFRLKNGVYVGDDISSLSIFILSVIHINLEITSIFYVWSVI